MKTTKIPGRKATGSRKAPIKVGQRYKVRIDVRVLTATVRHVRVKGRGHTIEFSLKGILHSLSATEFRSIIIQPW